jgi:tetratricopeptide (TPR) repeat protein
MIRVFISSTSEDLRDHREAVRDAVMTLGMHPVMMEHFPAMDADAVAACRQKVIDCDLFVGIYAHRYGHIPQGETRSITEMEYDWAGEAGLPRRVFVINRDYAWPDEFREHDKTIEIDAFRQRSGEKVWAEFTTPDSLAAKVTQSLVHDAKRLSRERRQQRNLIVGSVALLAILLVAIIVAIWASQPESSDEVARKQTQTAAAFVPSPTPFEGEPAQEGEIVVVVAKFEKTSGAEYEPHIDMLEVLEQAAEEVGNVRVIALNQTIQDHEEAQRISDVYNATMVVYGRVAPGGVTARYKVTPRYGYLDYVIEGDFRISLTDVDEFEAFLYEGLDARYVLWATIGQLHYFNRDYDQAIIALSHAVDFLDLDRADSLSANVVLYFRANAHRWMDEMSEALSDYDRAISINPRDPFSLNNRGALQGSLGNYQLALSDFDRALEVKPDYAMAYANRGDMYRRLGNLEQALIDCNRAIELDPNLVLAYNDRGVVYLELGEAELAIADFNQAIELNSDYVYALINRSSIDMQLGNYDAALHDLNHALSIRPDFAEAYYNRGLLYGYLGQYELAIADQDRAIELQPDFADAYIHRGGAHIILGEYKEALADLRKYVELAGDNANPEVLDVIAQLEAELE